MADPIQEDSENTECAPTFFTEAIKHFYRCQTGVGTNTNAFLDGCTELAAIFNILGGSKFKLAKDDFTGQIAALREAVETNPKKYNSLEKIARLDWRRRDNLLYLKRSLEFIGVMVDNLCHTDKEVSACVRIAYNEVLSKYHGWILRALAKAITVILPYRETFIHDLGPECENGEVMLDMNDFFEIFSSVVETLVAFYEENDWDARHTNFDPTLALQLREEFTVNLKARLAREREEAEAAEAAGRSDEAEAEAEADGVDRVDDRSGGDAFDRLPTAASDDRNAVSGDGPSVPTVGPALSSSGSFEWSS